MFVHMLHIACKAHSKKSSDGIRIESMNDKMLLSRLILTKKD